MEGHFETTEGCRALFMDFDRQHAGAGTLWLLGMPFFRAYYTVFSQEPRTMSFARAGDNCTLDASPSLLFPGAVAAKIRVNMSKLMPPRWLEK
uniref:Peptidase A1 domain-containing protein n=1 Tax=Noctiluca scintillans TaxID=2966 RepID=A0A7S1FD26_NOCSC